MDAVHRDGKLGAVVRRIAKGNAASAIAPGRRGPHWSSRIRQEPAFMSVRNLDRLLEPASIAVAGASTRPGSVGATVWRNLRGARFERPIHPVNPKHASLDGVPCFRRPADLPLAPDVAI